MNKQEVFDALKYRIDVDEDGTRHYYNSAGELHREKSIQMGMWNGTRMENCIASTDRLLSGGMAPKNGTRMGNYIVLMDLQLSGQVAVKTGISMASG